MDKDSSKVPAHVSIIMDGNGRWAAERGRERTFGHVEGVNRVRDIVEEAAERGVSYLSLYAFSEENWRRSGEEVSTLMRLMMKSVQGERETLMKNGVRFIALGNRARLNPVLNKAISALEDYTRDNGTLTLIVFISYSGRWDILQAVKKVAALKAADPLFDAEGMSAEDFEGYLVTSGFPDPDLIIRTSGEQRISNYLLWQGAYSEFYFTNVLWPDFTKVEFGKALEAYAARDRRYGGVK